MGGGRDGSVPVATTTGAGTCGEAATALNGGGGAFLLLLKARSRLILVSPSCTSCEWWTQPLSDAAVNNMATVRIARRPPYRLMYRTPPYAAGVCTSENFFGGMS